VTVKWQRVPDWKSTNTEGLCQ